MKIAKLCAVLILVLAAACVLPPPKPFPVNLELKLNAESVGKDHEVMLEVSDKRVAGGPSINYTIPVEGDFAAIVRDLISQGLQSEGFTIVPAKPAGGHELRVDILTLRHRFHAGMLVPYLQYAVIVDLKSACVAANVVQLEKQYSKSDWTCCFHSQTRGEMELQINRTVSTAINQMLNDDQLRQCLVEPKQAPGSAAAHPFPRRTERFDTKT
jgi:Uncharacterized lipoprotein